MKGIASELRFFGTVLGFSLWKGVTHARKCSYLDDQLDLN